MRPPLAAETAEQLLANSHGLTTAVLAEQAGADRAQVLLLLGELELAQRVTTHRPASFSPLACHYR